MGDNQKVCAGGIAAVEDMRQAYIVKHIRKSLTLLGSKGRRVW